MLCKVRLENFKSEILHLVFRDKISLRHGKLKSKETQILREFALSVAGYLVRVAQQCDLIS